MICHHIVLSLDVLEGEHCNELCDCRCPQARVQILQIHTRHWEPKVSCHFLAELANKCVGERYHNRLYLSLSLSLSLCIHLTRASNIW